MVDKDRYFCHKIAIFNFLIQNVYNGKLFHWALSLIIDHLNYKS